MPTLATSSDGAYGPTTLTSSLPNPLLIGDFNEILEAQDRTDRFSVDTGVTEFRDFVASNGLVDLNFNGALYT